MPRAFHSPQYELLVQLLREGRESRGITQASLAEDLGFRQTDISKVERGVRRLDVLELRAWTAALGLDFVAFIRALDGKLHALESLHSQASPVSNPKQPRAVRRP